MKVKVSSRAGETRSSSSGGTFDSSKNMDISKSRRIAILGKTGVGKSSLANTLFGEPRFKVGHNVNSETTKCQAETKRASRGPITLIDTPGFFDTERSEAELKAEILRCITEFSPGPHAFLIVLKVERFTEQEQAVVEKVNRYFSEEVFQFSTVLFTHGDQLPDGDTIGSFVRANKSVRELVEKCGGRCHVIDNKYWKNNPQDKYRNNRVQVTEILNTINRMIDSNRGRCYTNEMLQEVERKIKQEVERIRQTAGNKSEGEMRHEAKDNVFKWLWSKLKNIASDALWGALFGLKGMMTDVIKALAQKGLAGVRGAVSLERAVDVALRGAIGGVMRGLNASEGADPQAGFKCSDLMMQSHFSLPLSNELRIVLVGKNKVGKSSLANLLFGDPTFQINNLSDLETHSTTVRTKLVGGRSLSLIDTPGFFDPCRSEEAMLPEMLRCSAECAPGPHAFLIVFKVEKFIERNKDVVAKMCQYFPKNALKYGVIVFTHGDQLPEGTTLESYIEENGDLGDLVKKCGGRCHVVDSRYWTRDDAPADRCNRIHVAALLRTVERLVEENKGEFYSDGKIREIGERIRREEELLRATPGSMSQGEIRERAMCIVVKKQVDAAARGWGRRSVIIAGVFGFISGLLIRYKLMEYF